MKFSGLFEKLEILLDLIINSNVFIIFLLLIIAVVLLKLTNAINNKKMGIFIFLIELAILGVVFYEGNTFLTKIGNELIDSIFLNFYFPSVYVYLFIFVTTLVIFIYTLLNRFLSKTYKTVTNTYFLIFNFIFIILLNVISENNIDIFSKESLFTNNNTLILLELSTLLFFIYIVTMALIYFTNSIIMFVGSKRSLTKEENDERLQMINELNIEVPIENKESNYIQKPLVSFQELVQNIEKNDNTVELVPEVNIIKEPETINNDFKFIDPVLLKETKEVVRPSNKEVMEEKINFMEFIVPEPKKEENLTLNDYKLFSDMLKTAMKNNNNNNLTSTDILNKNLLNKYSEEEYSKFERMLNSRMN